MSNPQRKPRRVPLVSLALVSMAAHTVNQAYCAITKETIPPDWDDLPDFQKEDIFKGVHHHLGLDAPFFDNEAKDYLFRAVVHGLSIPFPEGDEDTLPVVSVDQFAALLSGWHTQKTGLVKHMLNIPEGTDIDVEDKKVKLTGDTRTAFQAGILTALSELGTLPFLASGAVEDEAQPAANDAATPSQ